MADASNASDTFEALDAAWGVTRAHYRSTSEPLAIAFSGGVDSSLLAWELRGYPELRLTTVGTRGSRDLSAAREASSLLGLPWHGTVVEEEDVVRTARELEAETRGASATVRRVLVAIALTVARSGAPRLLFGQGVDELFLGYAHYRGLDTRAAALRAEEDLDRLLRDDWPRTVRIARRFGTSVGAPYLDPAFVEAARRIPVERRLPTTERTKDVFRAWARHRGLPSALADRPKRAMQYGSGIDRALRTAERARITNG